MAAARPARLRTLQHDPLASLKAPRAFVDLRTLLHAVHESDGGTGLGESAYESDEETRAFFREAHASHQPARVQSRVPPLLPPANWRTPDHSNLQPLPEFDFLLAQHHEGKGAEEDANEEDSKECAEGARVPAGDGTSDGMWSGLEEGIFDWRLETGTKGIPNELQAVSVSTSDKIRSSPDLETSTRASVATPSKTSNADSDPEDTLELLCSPSLPDMTEVSEILDPVLPSDSLRSARPPQRIPGVLPRAVLTLGEASDSKRDQREVPTCVTTRAAAREFNDSEFEAFIRDNNKRVQRERIESRRARAATLRGQTAGHRTPPMRIPFDSAVLPSDSTTNQQTNTLPGRAHNSKHPGPRNQNLRPVMLSGSAILLQNASSRPERRPVRYDRQLHHQPDQGSGMPRIRGHVQFTSASTSSRSDTFETRPPRQDVSDQADDGQSSDTVPVQESKAERGMQGRRVNSALGSATSHITSRPRPNQASALHKEKFRQQAADRRDERDLAELLSRHNSQLQSQHRLVFRKPP
jgi:hypothetical protein